MKAVEGGNRRVSLLSSFAKELRTKALKMNGNLFS